MSNNEKTMLVTKIDKGTVIDKIPAGKSLQVLRILNIDEDVENTVAVAIRVKSQSMGIKDMVKLKHRELSNQELRKLWMISPNAKVSIIDNYEVADQFRLSDREFSKIFRGVLKCNNPTCATNRNEPVKPEFNLMQRNPILVRCLYCDRVMVEQNVREQL